MTRTRGHNGQRDTLNKFMKLETSRGRRCRYRSIFCKGIIPHQLVHLGKEVIPLKEEILDSWAVY